MSEANQTDYTKMLSPEVFELAHHFDEIRPGDVRYLCDFVYPSLQLGSPKHDLSKAQLSIIEAKNGWKIMDYGDVLSASALHDKEASSGSGTIIKQQFDVAFAMMELVKKRNWHDGDGGNDGSGEGELKPSEAEILGGTPMMCRFAWLAAEILKIKLNGFTPTAEDQKWLEALYSRHLISESAAAEMTMKQQ
jgi:hypothetical protein